nr:hypothetical protein [Tanacetum cinerariifolium]
MSRDVLTVGSTMRISLLYRGEYSQWVERFMNYLEEQTDGEAMINSIKNGDKPLPYVTQVSIAGTSSTEQPPLKDKSINKTAKDLCDALARHMLGSEYGEQDRKASVLYEYETFKATEGELLLDTYIRYLQQNQRDVNDAMGSKKKNVVVTSDPLDLIAEKTKSANKKQEFFKSDDKKVEKKDDEKKRDISKVKCYNCKKEEHFTKDCKKAKEINANMVFMAQIEKVLLDSEASSSTADDKISEVTYYLSESESESEYETSEYYDNTTNYGLFVNDNDDQEIFHEYENFHENLIETQTNHSESVVNHNDYEGIDKLIRKFNKKIVKCQKRVEKANQQIKDFKNQNKDLQDNYDVLKNQATTFEMNNKELNEQLKVLIEKNDDLLAQTKVLKDQLQVKHVVIDTHVEYDYFQEIINPDFEKIDSPFQQTSSLKPYVLNVILEKIIIDLKDEVVNLLEKEKANLETIESLKSKGLESSETVISKSENQCENDCLLVEKEYLDTFSSVRRPKNSGVIWKKKGSSNTSNVGLSVVSVSNLNKNVKRYSRKDLLACNSSHPRVTSSAFVCNDAMNVSCDSRINDLLGDNNFFIFDDESVRISHVSKMPFRKKPRESMHVRSKSNSNKSLPRTVHKWLPKLKPLAEPVAKWFPKVMRQIDKIFKTPNSSGPIFKWHVRTDNGTKFKNKTLVKFFDEVGITQQFFAARTPQQNGVVERRNRTLVEATRTILTFANLPLFLWAEAIATACSHKIIRLSTKDVGKLKEKGDIRVFVGYLKESNAFKIYNKQTRESSSSCLNDEVQQHPEEVVPPQTNTQSISNNMIPNGDEATYPHKKKWTKDHPLHKIIGDSKSSVRTRGQLANSSLFSCLLSSIEPANVAKALMDTDWVSAMQEELD